MEFITLRGEGVFVYLILFKKLYILELNLKYHEEK